MLNIKHLKTLLIFWILIMQYCVFTETLMAKKYSPINRCRDAWCWHEDRINRQKLIELAEKKRGITKKKDPFGLRFRHFQGEISSETARQKDASFALHWKKWGIGQTRSEYAIKGNYEIQYEAVSNTYDLLYTFGSSWTLEDFLPFPSSLVFSPLLFPFVVCRLSFLVPCRSFQQGGGESSKELLR